MTTTPAWPRYAWTLYVHVDPFPALAAAWGRPERLEPASSPTRWVYAKIDGGGSQTKGQLVTDVVDALVRLAGITGASSGEGSTLLVDVDGERYEIALPEDAHARSVTRLLRDLP